MISPRPLGPILLWLALIALPLLGRAGALPTSQVQALVCARIATGAPVLAKPQIEALKAQSELSQAIDTFHKTLKFQLEEFQVDPKELNSFIKSFPAETQTLVGNLLLGLTQWGNPQSMAGVLEQIWSSASPNRHIVSFSDSDIGAVLGYLDVKSFGIIGMPPRNRSPKSLKRGDVVVLCPEMKTYLEKNPEFYAKLVEYKTPIISLEGFDIGLTWANSTLGLNSLRPTLQTMLDQINKRVDVSDTMTETSQIFRKIGLSEWLSSNYPELSKNVKAVSAKTNLGDSENKSVLRRILSQLNPYIPSKEEIRKRLKRMNDSSPDLPVHQRDLANTLVLNHLADFMRFAHHRSLQAIVLGVGSQIQKTAQAWGVPPENIEFLVPLPGKSYTAVNFFRQELKIFPTSKAVTKIRKNTKNSPRTIVILDDVTGSGDSFVRVLEGIELAENDSVIFASLFSTEAGNARISEKLNQLERGPKAVRTHWIGGETLRTRTASNYYRTRDGNIQVWLENSLGEGFASTNIAVAFPHMSPNNDVPLFSYFFADLLSPPKSIRIDFEWDRHQVRAIP